MDTTPSRRRRRDRQVGRATASTRPPPDQSLGEQAVADAEGIVADAWVQTLITHRNLRQTEAQVTEARCETARRTLATALLERQPGPIAAAHAGLEEALSAAREAKSLHAHAQEGLALELDRLYWQSVERTIHACIARGGPVTHDGAASRPADPEAPTSALRRWSRHLVPWVFYLAASFTAGAHRS